MQKFKVLMFIPECSRQWNQCVKAKVSIASKRSPLQNPPCAQSTIFANTNTDVNTASTTLANIQVVYISCELVLPAILHFDLIFSKLFCPPTFCIPLFGAELLFI